jgi:hypothetical protein
MTMNMMIIMTILTTMIMTMTTTTMAVKPVHHNLH